MNHSIAPLLVIVLFVAGCGDGAEPSPDPVRNVILCIGDGMGVASITAARVLHGHRTGVEPAESADLFLDTMPYSALCRTYSANQRVTDSSAAMTAVMTGEKCQSRVVCMDASTDYQDALEDGDGQPLRTFLEIAESIGKATGLVTTTRVTHATPACCYAHHNSRRAEAEIAEQLLSNPALEDGIEVILGGGRQHFIPVRDASGERMFDEEGDRGARRDTTDLRPLFRQRGYTYVYDQVGFEQVNPAETDRLLGLFEESHMEYEAKRGADQAGEPALADMVEKAIAILSRDPDGFFLMIEGGRIDHALHDGKVMLALEELLAFDAAVRRAASLVDLDETLILATGDHDHTLVIAGYPPTGSPVNAIAGHDKNGVAYASLLFAAGPGPRPEWGASEEELESIDYVSSSALPLRSGVHGGMDLPLYALGAAPYAGRVRGNVDNTDIFEFMRAAIEGR